MNSYGLQGTESKKLKYSIGYFVFMLVLALLSLQIATQFMASRLYYQEALGKYILIGNLPIYPFWKAISWGMAENAFMKVLFDKSMEYAMWIFTLPQIAILLFLLRFSINKGNAKLHGSATWANKKAIEKMGYFIDEGVYVGSYQKNLRGKQHYLMHNGPEHILCFAPTRSGKGIGLILPSLLAWKGSSIVLDIKGENWALTSGYRKSLGHKVLRFDPTDTSGNCAKFNPLEEINLNSLSCVQEVQNMAMMIVDPDGKGLNDHWTKAVFAFFSGIILHCCIMVKAKKNRYATLQDLALMMSGYEKSISDLLDEMCVTNHYNELLKICPKLDKLVADEAHAFIVSSAMEMKGKAENEASGVLSSALVNMALYRDPIINLNTSQSDFRLADIMNYDEPVDLYLVISPADIDRVRPLIRLMADMLIRKICKEMAFENGASVKGYKHKCLLMFDEFTSLGKLPIIEKAIAYIAGYGGKMYLIVQDITQLNGVYGKDNALMANCHVRIAYAPNTIETAKVLSEMTGKTTVVEKKKSISQSRAGTTQNINISEVARPLLTPDECMRLPSAQKDAQGKVTKAGHMLIFTAGQNPIYGVQILYFMDKVFIERARIAPPDKSDSLYYNNAEIEVQESAEIQSLPIAEEEENKNIVFNFDDYLED